MVHTVYSELCKFQITLELGCRFAPKSFRGINPFEECIELQILNTIDPFSWIVGGNTMFFIFLEHVSLLVRATEYI